MALKAVHVSDVPNLDHVPENASLALYSTRFSNGVDVGRGGFKIPKFVVIGHRGSGMNVLHTSDRRMKAIKENSILSFNTAAATSALDFIEFDVQVTKDGCPIIFHDDFIISEDNVVFDHAKDRPIIFSTFHPDVALLTRKLQSTYPVFFLTNGGTELYYDVRRNSLEEAVKLCLEGRLQGIVSEVKGVFRNPGALTNIKEAKLSLLTYGKLNNVPEAVYLQHLMGVEGVIVDLVQEITEAVSVMIKPSSEGEEEVLLEGKDQIQVKAKPQFSQRELSFLLKLIPELIQI
ncbi:hypothetical protein ACSBR2_010778 [Camellia fascicularis]